MQFLDFSFGILARKPSYKHKLHLRSCTPAVLQPHILPQLRELLNHWIPDLWPTQMERHYKVQKHTGKEVIQPPPPDSHMQKHSEYIIRLVWNWAQCTQNTTQPCIQHTVISYCGNFRGRNCCKFCSLIAVCESFLHEILGIYTTRLTFCKSLPDINCLCMSTTCVSTRLLSQLEAKIW